MDVPVFTYGTLMSELVLEVVLGRVPERIDAELKGYSRHPIKDQCYPAVAPNPNGSVKGCLLVSLSAEELIALDAFEDPAYERCLLSVKLNNGTSVMARVWARTAENVSDLDLGTDWYYHQFRQVHEENYVLQCGLWAQEYYDSINRKK